MVIFAVCLIFNDFNHGVRKQKEIEQGRQGRRGQEA